MARKSNHRIPRLTNNQQLHLKVALTSYPHTLAFFSSCQKYYAHFYSIMTTETVLSADPFVDPASSSENTSLQDNAPAMAAAEDSTLVLGRDVSLTLGTDSLIILGMSASTSLFVFMRNRRGKRRSSHLPIRARLATTADDAVQTRRYLQSSPVCILAVAFSLLTSSPSASAQRQATFPRAPSHITTSSPSTSTSTTST